MVKRTCDECGRAVELISKVKEWITPRRLSTGIEVTFYSHCDKDLCVDCFHKIFLGPYLSGPPLSGGHIDPTRRPR